MAITFNVVTVLDEVRGALGWAGTDSKVTDLFIERFIFQHIPGTETTYTLQKRTTGVFTLNAPDDYGIFILFASETTPFTGEDGLTYIVNCRGSVNVTVGAATATEIAIVGAAVDFSAVMVDILHWLATHRCQELSLSVGGISMTPTGVKDELIAMAQYWQGITRIA